MNATVQKWGNSLALRIPSSVAKDIRLRQGSPVEVVVENGRMIVKPTKKRKPSLSLLLKNITKDNRHAEQGWGAPIGKEAW
ncbi:MAG: AbrB/MazE/SpoVT family DNA-binding domain-containing protein [Elusimicrobiota bacterium]|nr:AbrB/MazE/SpoVT family DNA-binding domain-containing protein [Elusimicrobiota bacterium]